MKKTFSILAVLAVGSGLVQAATITYTNSVVMNNDQNAVINLNKFDSSLGELTAVYVRYVAAIGGANVQLDNDSDSEQSGTARVQNFANSFSSTPSTLSTTFTTLGTGDFGLNVSQVFLLGATSGDTVGQFNITGESDYADWTPGTLQAIGESQINELVFSQYTGDGTYSVSLNSTFTTTATFDGSLGYFQGNTPTGAFSGEVTYTYSPIPEPATASFMTLAGLIALLVRRHLTK